MGFNSGFKGLMLNLCWWFVYTLH